MKKRWTFGNIFLVCLVGYFILKAYTGQSMGGGEYHNPNPQPKHSAVCNQYFKGGC